MNGYGFISGILLVTIGFLMVTFFWQSDYLMCHIAEVRDACFR